MTKTKESTKRAPRPSRRTPKRKRALALMLEWAAEGIEVELSQGSGLFFTGTIVPVNFDGRDGQYLFRNDYGVQSHLITNLYEEVEVNEIETLPVSVVFTSKSLLGQSFSLIRKPVDPSFETDLQQAITIFQQWEKLGTVLQIHVGDPMRSTMSHCSVKELSRGTFLFESTDSETVHAVRPARSSSIYITTADDRTLVSLFNKGSGSTFGATNGVDSPEAVIDRFAAQTSRLQ